MTDENDRYERTNGPRTAGQLFGDVEGITETLGHSPEWWQKQNQRVAAWKEETAELAERTRMANRAGDLRDNGFPSMAIAAALGEMKDTPALEQAKFFRQTPQRIIILSGGVGVGKTTVSAWLSLKGQDPRPGFIRIGELERRGRYDKKLDDWLQDKTSLVIDDVGTEVLDGKNVFTALFGEIVDMFYSNRRTLIMTTNLRPRRSDAKAEKKDPNEIDQFAERYGDRVWSRLSQYGFWADCGMRDLRKEQP